MSDSKSLGMKGEDLAVEHLKGKGYTIRHRNWVSGKKEIDIVAENRDFVVFVEVKTRSVGGPILKPEELVPRDKQKLMQYGAESYIHRYNINKDSRFDIILIQAGSDGFSIEHIEDAFYPTLR